MLFNSYSFIFYFLIPIFLIFLYIPNRYKIYYLILSSSIFYIEWSLKDFYILIVSIVTNYSFAVFISKYNKYRVYLLYIIIIFNIILLGYFKYSNFLGLSHSDIALPLAISFFTFQQIAYIIDIYIKNIIVESFSKYLFFILFFPQLIAGPIMHYKSIINQISSGNWYSFNIQEFEAGVTLFAIGLFKKVVLADNLLHIVNSSDVWSGLFAYSFMIYFDFSGYADMAIGLGLLFGIKLAINFNSPYKAYNLIEFWRRWHITLSNFLRDYIYIPLGGNKKGLNREFFALIFTMLIGGIWHGAGWNFLIWGLFHGLGLALVHFISKRYSFDLNRYLSTFLTFVYVTLLWVLFKSQDLNSAMEYYIRLIDFDLSNIINSHIYILILLSIIIWLFPNSMELIRLDKENFNIKWWYSYMSGVLFFVTLKVMADTPSIRFVYFNF